MLALVWAAPAMAAVDAPMITDLTPVVDAGCTGCNVSNFGDLYLASIASAADNEDSAYGVKDVGGSGGIAERVWVRAWVGLDYGQTLDDTIQVLEIRDTNDAKMLEVSINSSRQIGIYSPPGGLRSTDLGGNTGVVVPNDGSGPVRVEVSMLKNGSVSVRVNGIEKLSIGGLSGATTTTPRYIRGGITGYNGSSTSPVSMSFYGLGVTTEGWLYGRREVMPSGGSGDEPWAQVFSTDGAYPGCASCRFGMNLDEVFEATVAGAADTEDSAFGTMDFGGSEGWSDRTFLRTRVGLGEGQTPTDSLVLLEVRDTNDAKMFELYVGSDRKLALYSPPGGLRASDVSLNTNVVVPNDGTSMVRAEVSFGRNDGVTVRVNGIEKVSLSGFGGATTTDPRYLRVGITGYNGSSTTPITALHRDIGITSRGWLYGRRDPLPEGSGGDIATLGGLSSDGAFPSCASCAVSFDEPGSVDATVAGAADSEDSAYGTRDFGGSDGWSDRTFARTRVGLAEGDEPADNLHVLELRDTNDAKLLELSIQPDRTLVIYSPPGGLRSTDWWATTGVKVPNDGLRFLTVEVSVDTGDAVVVRVDGEVKASVGGLSGASTTAPRYLRAGITGYNGSSTTAITVRHRDLSVTSLGWSTPAAEADEFPQMEIAHPLPECVISGDQTIRADYDAADGWSAGDAQFILDGQPMATDPSPPFTAAWDTGSVWPGDYTIDITLPVVRDSDDEPWVLRSSTVTMEVSSPPGTAMQRVQRLLDCAGISEESARVSATSNLTNILMASVGLDADIVAPRAPTSPLSLTDGTNAFSVLMPSDAASASGQPMSTGMAYYAGSSSSLGTVVQTVDAGEVEGISGLRVMPVLFDSGAGDEFEFELGLPSGASATLTSDARSVTITNSADEEIGYIDTDDALDSSGASVPATLDLDGDTLTMSLDTADAQYPIVASLEMPVKEPATSGGGAVEVRENLEPDEYQVTPDACPTDDSLPDTDAIAEDGEEGMIACATETPDEIVDEVYGDLSGPLQAQALDPQRPVATRRSWTVVPSVRVYFWNDFRSGPFCAVGGGNHKVFAAATITAKASVALDVPAALSSRMTREVRFSRVTSVDDCVDTGIPMTLSSLQSGIGTLIFVRFKDTLCVTGQGCQNHETNFDSIDSSGKVTNVEDRALTSDALQRQHFRWTLGWGDVVADLPAYTNTNAPLERATPLIRCDTVRYFQPTRRGCVFRDILGKMGFDQSTIPNVTANIADAWARGKPNILRRRVNERLKRRNRAIACAPLRRTTTPPPGKNSCDEYPMAVTWQGGRGAITAWVPGVENSRQGGAMSRAFREDRILDGERFQVFLYSSAL